MVGKTDGYLFCAFLKNKTKPIISLSERYAARECSKELFWHCGLAECMHSRYRQTPWTTNFEDKWAFLPMHSLSCHDMLHFPAGQNARRSLSKSYRAICWKIHPIPDTLKIRPQSRYTKTLIPSCVALHVNTPHTDMSRIQSQPRRLQTHAVP